MREREFFLRVADGPADILGIFLQILEQDQVRHCVIGGLAVNAYAEPVVSLDLDVVVAAEQLPGVLERLRPLFTVEDFPNSINIGSPGSDLRIQIQKDPRYQSFLERAMSRPVLGYSLPVAAVEDVLQGKIWAALDRTRRPSKRQKDLADILRLVEGRGELQSLLPEEIRHRLETE
jgi:hypothetical protein